MTNIDFSAHAASITDDLLQGSDGLGPEHRDSIRVLLRVAFEVQEFLHSNSTTNEALDWTQDTVFSACDSLHLARSAWQFAARLERGQRPMADTFPKDLRELSQQLDDSVRTIQDSSLSLMERLRAVNHAARLQLLFLGATLW